jgi:ABC-type proline/glycine betaine transport system substrate-binding protein
VVAVSRALAIPKYMTKLGLASVSEPTINILMKASFIIMCFALAGGAFIILGAMWKAKRAETAAAKAAEFVTAA